MPNARDGKEKMTDRERVIEILRDRKATYAFVRGTEEIFGTEKGIAPLLCRIAEKRLWSGFSAADKIVGKAAALLYVYMGVAEVYAEVLSDSAESVFVAHNIPYGYHTRTDRIINRRGDDVCPMEKAVADCSDPARAVVLLREKCKKTIAK